MAEDRKHMIEVLKIFVEGTLVDHDPVKSLSVISEDVIGIGMGSQGVVTCKADLEKILNDEKTDGEGSVTMIEYDNIQIRCYEEKHGVICAVLKIKTLINGETKESSLGQMLGVRKEADRWLIYAVQATPMFHEIEEMEAYPIKFAEGALEKYRQQEQLAKNFQQESAGIYKVNFTKGIFEDCVLKNDIMIRTEKGESYEKAIFDSAWRYLKEDDRYQFIRMFSMGNVIKEYKSGQTELFLEYEMMLPEGNSEWLRTVVRMYMDKTDENLKGYLYVFDINEKKRKEIELQSKIEQDPLTELYNKKYTELKIAESLKMISPFHMGSFFMIDLDCFKNINDTYGHKEGDRVIQEAARCIKSMVRKSDIAGRIGGDEFCIYFHGELKLEKVLEKAEIICEKIRAIIPSPDHVTSCSIGIVLCDCSDMTFEEIYQKADVALYEQKRKGKNGYTVYGS